MRSPKVLVKARVKVLVVWCVSFPVMRRAPGALPQPARTAVRANQNTVIYGSVCQIALSSESPSKLSSVTKRWLRVISGHARRLVSEPIRTLFMGSFVRLHFHPTWSVPAKLFSSGCAY
jgi:hypothetical protein